MIQKISVLGSTGSIGSNTLDVLARHPDRFEVFALVAATQIDLLFAQCVRHRPRIAVLADAAGASELEKRIKAAGLCIEVRSGVEAICDVAGHREVDMVMAAIVGAAGLAPCLAAARAGKRLLLANKEALVVGGSVFMAAVHSGGATLLPIDSEHSAIFQSLPDDPKTWERRIERIVLTASGGPFRRRDVSTLHAVTPEEACAHPNWVMGRKISVDSATMMNKALEVIEAHFLFGVEAARLDVVIHPQSVIHSMVQYRDASVVAQLGTPDMRVPIAYGLSWPERIESGASALNFRELQALTFESLEDHGHRQRFPCLALAWQVLDAQEGSCAILNAANEIAVESFLDRSIRFDQIYAVNRETLERLECPTPRSLGDLQELDARARSLARTIVRQSYP